MKKDLQVWITLLVIMTFFASNSVITRYLVLLGRVSPFLLTVIRFVSGLATLSILPSVRPKIFHHDKPNVSYLPGAFFLGAYAFSISYGYVFISVAAGTLIFYTFVVLAMATYSVLVDKEQLTPRLVLGQLLGIAGVLVITFGKISSVTLLGVLLMAGTGVSWGLYSAYGRNFTVTFSYTYNSFLILGTFAIISSIALALVGQPIFTDISIQNLGLALYMGMISTALSYVLWNATVKKIPASLGGLVQLVVPVLAPIMGIIFLGEQVTTSLMVGGALVLVAIYLVGSKR
jgi:drug/metabolite transporter (DMT)-like permease